jgi:hypothetical protein
MSNTTTELIESFREWISFSRSLQELPEKSWDSSMEADKWTIKDVVCHMMLWDKYFYEEAVNKIATAQPISLKHVNYDEFNDRAIIYAKTITTEELIEKTIDYREKIIADIEALSEDAVNRNYIDGDGNLFYIPQYMKDFIGHDQHHMKPLKTFLVAINL